MKIGLIADSCCDMTPDICEKTNVQVIPLKVIVAGDTEYNDDGSVDIGDMLAAMGRTKEPARSASPSISDYCDAMQQYEACFVVTLSSKLSGSYNAACSAAKIVLEEAPDKKIHVFDSKSASAGETALLLYLQDQIDLGGSFEEIVESATKQIDRTRTLFVLQDLSNMIKNGRIKKLPGMIAAALSIYPLLGDNGDGEVRMLCKERGIRNALIKLADTVKDMTRTATVPRRLVLTYCHCAEQAEWLRQKLLEHCTAIEDVILVPTGALSSMYAGKNGIVVAFSQGSLG